MNYLMHSWGWTLRTVWGDAGAAGHMKQSQWCVSCSGLYCRWNNCTCFLNYEWFRLNGCNRCVVQLPWQKRACGFLSKEGGGGVTEQATWLFHCDQWPSFPSEVGFNCYYSFIHLFSRMQLKSSLNLTNIVLPNVCKRQLGVNRISFFIFIHLVLWIRIVQYDKRVFFSFLRLRDL